MRYIKLIVVVTIFMVGMCGCKKGTETEKEIKFNENVGDVDVSIAPVTAATTTSNPSSSQGTTSTTKEPSDATVSLLEAKNSSKYTVVIDAGHQQKGNDELEPIAPGATETKAKVSQGTTGVASNVAEYVVTLQVSQKLESLLKGKGYKVIMVRNSHNVNISNSERAQVANNANADAFIRIHCNGAENKAANGALTMCQTKNNPYCGQLYSMSRSLSQKVITRLCEATGANNKGILESDTMSGINWCSVPVTIVEMGFMSNSKEDKLLVQDAYQDKLAVGIANGVIEYLNNK